MTTTITAAVAREEKAPLTVEKLELDEIRPSEARVRLVAVGICHTDTLARDGVYPTPLPAVLGHEGAGVVEQVGSAVRTVNPGDQVIMSAAYCTHCIQCRSGHVAYCENLFAEDFGGRRTSDGTTSLRTLEGEQVSSHFFGQSSFATYANVVESALIPVPADVPLEAIAFLGCGMQTGAGAILNELRPPAGSSVAVSGTGAVGLAAIMAARVAGATTIVAIDIHDSRLELAMASSGSSCHGNYASGLHGSTLPCSTSCSASFSRFSATERSCVSSETRLRRGLRRLSVN